jgi:hypothetical protein
MARYQFPRHGGEEIVIVIHGLEPVALELTFERKRHQQLLAHEPQTALLRRLRVGEDPTRTGRFWPILS